MSNYSDKDIDKAVDQVIDIAGSMDDAISVCSDRLKYVRLINEYTRLTVKALQDESDTIVSSFSGTGYELQVAREKAQEKANEFRKTWRVMSTNRERICSIIEQRYLELTLIELSIDVPVYTEEGSARQEPEKKGRSRL